VSPRLRSLRPPQRNRRRRRAEQLAAALGVGRNTMPTRRVEVSGVTALDALVEAHEGQPIADLIAALVPAAQRVAYAMLQNAHDCEDAVQEATFKGLRVEITEVPTHE
jgi:hypothetical protein